MTKSSLKQLGTILLVLSLVFASIGFLAHRGLKQGIDERAESAGLAEQGQPLGGRFLTESEMAETDRNTYRACFSFGACAAALTAAFVCFHAAAKRPAMPEDQSVP
ncbi:MAG: hypothetical protein V2A76_12690 [Planctomycetota bacterium]